MDAPLVFSQKWRSKVSKANFCSKTVATTFAIFVLLSTSFPINLMILIVNVWCQSSIFSEMKVQALKSELLLEDNGYNMCCFCSSLNMFSNQFDLECLMSSNYFLRNEILTQNLIQRENHRFCQKRCLYTFSPSEQLTKWRTFAFSSFSSFKAFKSHSFCQRRCLHLCGHYVFWAVSLQIEQSLLFKIFERYVFWKSIQFLTKNNIIILCYK